MRIPVEKGLASSVTYRANRISCCEPSEDARLTESPLRESPFPARQFDRFDQEPLCVIVIRYLTVRGSRTLRKAVQSEDEVMMNLQLAQISANQRESVV